MFCHFGRVKQNARKEKKNMYTYTEIRKSLSRIYEIRQYDCILIKILQLRAFYQNKESECSVDFSRVAVFYNLLY